MAAVVEQDSYFCDKCHKTLRADEFYGSNNLEKYPNGKLNQCKKCITMHVDNWNPQTFLWILQECDVPYVREEWYKLLEKYGQDGSKVTGMTILGRYLSKMKLKQYKEYRWKDTEFLQNLQNHKTEEAMKAQGYSASEIAQVVNEQRIDIPEEGFKQPEIVYTPAAPDPEDYFMEQAGIDDIDLVGDLTEEDRKYLLMKWGKSYKPEEWIRLEQFYQEMLQSYDVQGAGNEDTLKLVCKTSLKANQLLDIGDIDGAQKMIKMYDGLMKSGKFTAAQNKANEGEVLNSISELVLICEKEGFIPRFATDIPQDKVDKTLKDMNNYLYKLVTQDLGFGQQIEDSLKKIQLQKEMNDSEISLDDEDIDEELIDAEYEIFYEEIQNQKQHDKEILGES
jgi:hypothetical protein